MLLGAGVLFGAGVLLGAAVLLTALAPSTCWFCFVATLSKNAVSCFALRFGQSSEGGGAERRVLVLGRFQ